MEQENIEKFRLENNYNIMAKRHQDYSLAHADIGTSPSVTKSKN